MKVFSINDCDWYMAESIFEAIEAAMKDCELPFAEACSWELGELSPDYMQRLIFVDDDGSKRTFAEQLEREIASDPKTARMFASTEF